MHRNAVPVPFWENGSSKLGPARSAVVIRGARVTRLTLLMPIAPYACRPTLLYRNVSGMSGSVSDPRC